MRAVAGCNRIPTPVHVRDVDGLLQPVFLSCDFAAGLAVLVGGVLLAYATWTRLREYRIRLAVQSPIRVRVERRNAPPEPRR